MRVAVAIITDAKQRILITRRPLHVSHGGFWEFPGGKLENEELASSALVREIKEEVGLEVSGYDYIGEVCYNYNQQGIALLVYHVHAYQGEAVCREAQLDLRWVEQASLKNYPFPPANLDIIALIEKTLHKQPA